MGEFGQRIVREDLEALRRVLMRAFSDEWFAHYNFRFVAGALRGHRAPDVVDFLRRRSDVAIARGDRLTHRLAVDVLADAVRAEQAIERLIDDAAPGMTGR